MAIEKKQTPDLSHQRKPIPYSDFHDEFERRRANNCLVDKVLTIHKKSLATAKRLALETENLNATVVSGRGSSCQLKRKNSLNFEKRVRE